jgi:hypothetical protein
MRHNWEVVKSERWSFTGGSRLLEACFRRQLYLSLAPSCIPFSLLPVSPMKWQRRFTILITVMMFWPSNHACNPLKP